MNLGVIWFSCERDVKSLAISRRSVQAHLPDAVQRVSMQGSTSRGINLNGIECIAEVLLEMRQFAREAGLDYVLKIDSDTLCFSSDWLRLLAPERWTHIGQASGFRGVRGVMGAAQVFHRSVFDLVTDDPRTVLEDLDRIHARRLSRTNWPEDKTVSVLSEFWFPDHCLWLEPRRDFKTGWLALWQFGKYGETIPTQAAARYWQFWSFVEVGRRVQMDWLDAEAERIALQERTMAELWRLSQEDPPKWL